jgi:hypothetical protein
MHTTEHQVRLSSAERFGTHVPPEAIAHVLKHLPALARGAVALAFRGSSISPAHRRSSWLDEALRLRFLGLEAADDTGDTILRFDAPRFGDAAAEAYADRSLAAIDDAWPSPEMSALDLVAATIDDIVNGNLDSARLDVPVLRTASGMKAVFDLRRGFTALWFDARAESPWLEDAAPRHLTIEVCDRARVYCHQTPSPRFVRVTGVLEGVQSSTQTFGLSLRGGQFVRNLLIDSTVESLREFVGRPVTVIGNAIYRPSGALLRLDAQRVERAETSRLELSSSVPPPTMHALHDEPVNPAHGLAQVVGMLGNESVDEEAVVGSMRELR